MAKAIGLLLCWLSPLIAVPSFAAEPPIQMIRALSGPSGKVVGGKFVLDEIRNRFVYPQDNSLTVYFEFKAPKGDYFLTAYWKDPQGRIVTIAPDLKIQTENEELNSYWILMLDEYKTSGIWTVDVRINGEPVGSHSFELVVPKSSQPTAAAETAPMPTMDELYRAISKALVWVHNIDGAGRRVGTFSGFISAPDSILTAFRSVDAAAKIEIEFADGARISTDQIIRCNRMQDWALLKAPTRGIAPLVMGKPESIIIGEPLIVFSVEGGFSRTIGTVDISGRRTIPGFGERVFTSPQLPVRAIGGPLLDFYGNVVGIIGGNMVPGLPADGRSVPVMLSGASTIAAIPIEPDMVQPKTPAVKFQELINSGILTPPLSETPVFIGGLITGNTTADPGIQSKMQFARGETVIIFTNWLRKENIRQGITMLRIYDSRNRLRSQGPPQTLKLPENRVLQYNFQFPAGSLESGIYRIDLFWDGLPVWRTFLSIMN